MPTELHPPGTLTVHFPESFCKVVLGLIAERGWKIKKEDYRMHYGGMNCGQMFYTLPDGTNSNQSTAEQALLDLCMKFVKKHHIPLRYHKTLNGLVNDESQVERKCEPKWNKPGPSIFGAKGTTFSYEYHTDDPDNKSSFYEAIRKGMADALAKEMDEKIMREVEEEVFNSPPPKFPFQDPADLKGQKYTFRKGKSVPKRS